MEFTAELIAGYLGGEIAGDPKAVVTKLAKIEEGEAGALAFLANPKYEHYIYDTKATIVIGPYCSNPFRSSRILSLICMVFTLLPDICLRDLQIFPVFEPLCRSSCRPRRTCRAHRQDRRF